MLIAVLSCALLAASLAEGSQRRPFRSVKAPKGNEVCVLRVNVSETLYNFILNAETVINYEVVTPRIDFKEGNQVCNINVVDFVAFTCSTNHIQFYYYIINLLHLL